MLRFIHSFLLSFFSRRDSFSEGTSHKTLKLVDVFQTIGKVIKIPDIFEQLLGVRVRTELNLLYYIHIAFFFLRHEREVIESSLL